MATNQENSKLEQITSLEIQVVFTELLLALQELKQPITVFTISEVAEILKCKERAVKHHLYEARDLHYLKVGREVRIREEDLKEFLKNQMMPCQSSRGLS